MKVAIAIFCFFITFMCFMIYLVGMHGHLMFRTYMKEDWIIWGIAFASFVIGVIVIIYGAKKRTHNKSIAKSGADIT